MVRISEGLRRKLEVSASDAGRSLSAEMLLRIEKSFENDDEIDELKAMVHDHEERIREMDKDITRLLDSSGLLYDGR